MQVWNPDSDTAAGDGTNPAPRRTHACTEGE